MKSKVLLTGSLGFIASSLIRKSAYEKNDYLFAGIDKACDAKQLNNIYNGKIITNNYLADINDQHIVNNIFQLEKPDIVIHGATYQPVSDHIEETKKCVDTNIIGTQILLEACKQHQVKKIIYLSSDNLYTATETDHPRNCEHNALDPKNLLQVSQLAAEKLIINSGVNYNILRVSNTYGPRQTLQYLVPKTLSNILNNQKIVVDGDGSYTSDWTHVFDVSSAILTVLKSEISNQFINVTSKQECSQIELIQFICNAVKKGHELIYCDSSKKVNHSRCAADNSKLINLGWKPNFKLRQGIQETCDWYNLNQYYLK